MGAISGLLAGLGLVLIWQACTSEPPQWRSERSRRLGDLLIQAGAGRTSPAAFVGGSLGFGAVVALGFLGTTGVWSIAAAFGTIAALLPFLLISSRPRPAHPPARGLARGRRHPRLRDPRRHEPARGPGQSG